MRYWRNILTAIVAVAIVAMTSGCSSSDPDKDKSVRTVLVYMIATNTLGSSGFDKLDLAEMDSYVKENGLSECKLVVYHASYDGDPQLFSIEREGGNVVHKVLATYADSRYSTNPERMREVIDDVRELAPSYEYGLILWGHGTGWALSLKDKSALRSFGPDYGKYMPVDELVSALPDDMFEFIYADICYFGSVEIAYQLRNKTNQFVGSASSYPASGMPYDVNLAYLLGFNARVPMAALSTFLHYEGMTGENRSITISLVDCTKLEALADVCKRINALGTEVTPDGIQQYVLPSDGFNIYFDFAQYYRAKAAGNEALLAEFDKALNEAVVYKGATDRIFDRITIDQEHFSGLSTYILGTASEANEAYYATLDWYKNVCQQ